MKRLPGNLDPCLHVYWFRRLTSHPSPWVGDFAARFRDVVAADLKLSGPYPDIIWFKPEDWVVASQEWQLARSQHPSADWSIIGNPFITPCECFRFEQEMGSPEIFCGYAHRDGPPLIGIAIEPPCCSILDSIAHECIHVRQDQREAGWRMEHRIESEHEAEAYVGDTHHRFSPWFADFQAGMEGKRPNHGPQGTAETGPRT